MHLCIQFQSNSRESLFAKQFSESKEKDFGILIAPQPATTCDDDDFDEDTVDDGNFKLNCFCLALISNSTVGHLNI